MNPYIHGVLVGLDEALAAVAFSSTQNDITISSRCGMAKIDASGLSEVEAKILIAGADALNALEPGHCVGAIKADAARARATLDLLEPFLEQIK